MKRLATLILAAGMAFSTLLVTGQVASATPFSDVPANHWAYQAIQSLAADGLVEGYPDGKFKGDRPMTRYEMAVLIARVIAKVQANAANYATKADLDKLQKLIDAFKDELDALGVRVTNLEDSLDALDKRTKFAQSIEFHGTMLPNLTFRQRTTLPRTVANGNGAGGANTPTTPYTALDNAFLSSDFSNSAYTQNGVSDVVRYDDKFTFLYHVNDNLTVSVPFHLMSSTYGGEFDALQGTGQGLSGNGMVFGIDPGVDVAIAKAGNMTNMLIKFGIQDNLKSSRTGLAYKAPDVSQQGPAYETPSLAYSKGLSFTSTLNGLTDMQFSFVRLDQTMLNTQTVLNPVEAFGFNSFLFNVIPNQLGYSQNGYPGPGGSATTSLTFSAGSGPLTQVYLTNEAQLGTVYVSQYNGTLYNSSGQIVGGGTIAAPAFVYDNALNAVIFTTPLPAGSTVTVTFVALTANNYNVPPRYQYNARINQKFKGIPGAEIGLTYNRILDLDDLQTTGPLTIVQTNCVCGFGLVSDTVFGLDAQIPLGFNLAGPDSVPILYGEIANSKFTPDYRNTGAVSDNAVVAGLNLKLGKITGSVQYQAVGTNFIDGAPFRYYGNAPATLAYWKESYFPAFYGFVNTLGLNTQFDNQFIGTGKVSTTSTNAALTYITPMINPFVGGGPNFFSAFTPNTQGVSGNFNIPFTVGGLSVAGRAAGSHLSEVSPNSVAAMQYGPSFATNTKEFYDRLEGAVNFNVPVFAQNMALGLGLSWDRVQRQDKTAFQYYPFNPNVGGADPASLALALAAYGTAIPAGGTYLGSQVSWYPNYINVQHWTANLTAAVPLTKNVTLSATYNAQNFGGYYQSIGQNMDEKKTFAIGNLTYTIPNSPSTIAVGVRNQQYKDNVIPLFNLNQTREDIQYTIRF
ncbi:MAG: S-layer homology domain-containing protein [Candidatus Eremiobacteraeota bacterium]|nr:S-layer homology domain-containing protein [Candidatus Eremiobacteraeota bacterium]MBV8353860.1 S-layer homology domain-containing protein [Candidatus Eremiobacteraeota bacterium]